MKKITFLLVLLFIGFISFGQTTVTIGTGTLVSAAGANGSPVYRSSAASAFNFSQSVELLTAADLSAVGITAGSTITKIAYKKLNAFTMAAGRTATMKIYLKNSSATALGTTTNFATYIAGSTLSYDNAAYSNTDLPATAGWVEFNFGTPFNYTGGSIEVGIDFAINAGAGNPTDGGFTWEYTTVTANQAAGTSNSVAITGALATAQPRIYNTQLTYTNSACTGTPAPGNTLVSPSSICYGSSATLSLQNPTIGSGVTYQWYLDAVAISGATNPNYVISSVTATGSYHCEVTCSGNTTPSTAIVVGPSIINAPTPVEAFNTFLPTCWLFGDNGDLTAGPATFATNSWKNDGFANVGATGSIAYNHFTTGANDWIISPVINVPATGYEVKFDASLTQWNGTGAPTTPWDAGDVLEVLVSTTGLDNWTVIHTIDNSNAPAAAGSSIAVDLDVYATQNIRIAYRVVSGATDGADDTDIFVDNFQVRLSPLCPDQTGLVVANITGSGADTSWDDMSGSGSVGYEYAITTSATPPASGTPTTNTFHIASGLSPLTVYYLHVRSECAGSTYGNWSTTTFTTACAPISAPVTENFGTFLPSVCWFNRTGGDLTTGPTSLTGSGWVADGFANAGTTGAIRNEIFTTGANDWFISPEITIPATGYELKFDAAATQFASVNAPTNAWEADDFIEVLVSTTGTTNWTVLHTYNDANQPSNTGTPNIIDLDAYASQNIRIAFRAVEGATNGTADIDFSIDNFQIRLTPTCIEPLNLVFSGVTSSTVNISWDPTTPSPTIGYEYFVSTASTVPVSAGTATTNTFATPGGLTPQTTYYVFVRSDCSAGDFSSWTGPVSFTTTCAPVSAPLLENFATFLPSVCWYNRTGGDLTTGPTSLTGSGWVADGFANAGTTGAIRNEIFTTGANDWFISPEITIPATGYELKFDAAATQFASTNAPTNAWEADDFIEVLVSTTGTTNWTVLHTYNDANQPANTGTPNIIDLDAYASQNVRIAFRAVEGATNGTADIDFSIDNFQIRLTPTCVEPLNLVSSGVTATTANISWDPTTPSPTTGYEYFVSTTSTIPVTPGTATTNTFAALSLLSPQTTYYIFVRSDCSAGDFSSWTGPISFTTACAPITTLPWNEGFEGLATVGANVYPPCWFKENGDWSSQNTNGTYSTSYTGTRYIRDSWSATNEYIWTPGFDLVAGTSYDFSSFVQGDNGTGWLVDYFVNSSQTSVGATQVGATYNVPGTGSPYAFQPYALVKRSFVPSTSGTYYFAVRVNQPGSGPWYVSFDDFKLELSPACPTPSASATNITDVSADLSWAAVPSAALGYEYVLDNIATDPAGSGTSTMALTYPAVGLTPTTAYYFHIRSVCSAGTYSAWSTTSFTTLLTPPANDNCGSAIALTPGATFASNPLVGTNVGATGSAETAPGCASYAGGDVWYSVLVPASGNITLETDTNTGTTITDTGLAVYSGVCGALVLVECDDDDGTNGNFSLVALTGRTPGEMLYVRAWEYGNDTFSTFQVSAYDASLSSASFDRSTFVAYPNPVKDVLNLSYKSVISNVKVVNLLGQEVLNSKTNANEVQINMSALNAGAYIVNIAVDDTVHTIKVIKE